MKKDFINTIKYRIKLIKMKIILEILKGGLKKCK